MGTLTVWKFDTAEGADTAADTLRTLVSQELVVVHDSATVSWPSDRKKPRTRQLTNLAAVGALSGAFWGMLFGLIFFVPLLGMAVGAASGALSGSFHDVGIDDGFIRRLREQITPGTSALFVLTSDAVMDRVHDAFAGQRPELLYTNLSTEQEQALHEVFDDA